MMQVNEKHSCRIEKEEASMKYNDTYSMIGAMLNQGFETEFKKEREKKEKRRRFFRKLLVMISRLKKSSGKISENMSNSAGKCKCDARTICTCAGDCSDRV